MDDLTKINLDEQPVAVPPSPTVSPSAPVVTPRRAPYLLSLTVAIILGLGTGWWVARQHLMASAGPASNKLSLTQNPSSADSIKVGDVYGTADEKTFNDQAEGVLIAGGIDGEGSHHLERGANKSQWVYLTSSVVDLDNFQGHKVQVWGRTVQGKKAGWLMDVGRLKVLELGVGSGVGQAQED